MKKLPVIIALLLLSACIYRFDPDVSKDSGRIVIEGDILIGDTTVVRVSRLQPLKAVSSEASPAYTAWVESSDGSSIHPYRTSKDTSFIDTTTPSTTASYRLCVLTAEGVKYASSWQMVQNADFRFLQDVRKYVEEKIGEVKYADELMKRIMLANNKDKGMEYVEKNYEASIKELTWSLAKNQIVEALKIKVDDADVKAVAIDVTRMQFAQYGMTSVPEEYLEQYAEGMLKNREQVDNLVNAAVDRKLMTALKDVVKLNKKTISFDEFRKLD